MHSTTQLCWYVCWAW